MAFSGRYSWFLSRSSSTAPMRTTTSKHVPRKPLFHDATDAVANPDDDDDYNRQNSTPTSVTPVQQRNYETSESTSVVSFPSSSSPSHDSYRSHPCDSTPVTNDGTGNEPPTRPAERRRLIRSRRRPRWLKRRIGDEAAVDRVFTRIEQDPTSTSSPSSAETAALRRTARAPPCLSPKHILEQKRFYEQQQQHAALHYRLYQQQHQNQYCQGLYQNIAFSLYSSIHPFTIAAAAVVGAVIFRQPLFLRLLPPLVFLVVAERAAVWTLYFANCQDTKRLIDICTLQVQFWLRQTNRAVRKRGVRRVAAGVSVKTWNVMGKSLTYHVWNAHTRAMKRRNQRETQSYLSFIDRCHNLIRPPSGRSLTVRERFQRQNFIWQQAKFLQDKR